MRHMDTCKWQMGISSELSANMRDEMGIGAVEGTRGKVSSSVSLKTVCHLGLTRSQVVSEGG